MNVLPVVETHGLRQPVDALPLAGQKFPGLAPGNCRRPAGLDVILLDVPRSLRRVRLVEAHGDDPVVPARLEGKPGKGLGEPPSMRGQMCSQV